MKKLLSLVLAVLMCISPLAATVGAAGVEAGNNALYELGSAEGEPGDTILVPVLISTGALADSFSFKDLTFDENALEFAGFEPNTEFLKDAIFKAFDNTKMTIAIGYNLAETEPDYSVAKQVCAIKFNIKDTAPVDEYTITGVPNVKKGSVVFDVGIIPATVTVKGKDFPKDIKLNDATFPYDGTKKSIAVTGANPGDYSGFNVSYECLGNDFDGAVDAGTYDITATVTADGYNRLVLEAALKITQKDVTVTGKLADKEYDGTANGTWEVVPAIEGKIEGDDLDVAYASENQFAKKDAGTKITVNHGVELVGEDAGNYRLAKIDIPATAKISPRAIEVTIDNKTVRIGDELPALTYSVTKGSLVEGEAFTGELATTAKNTNTVKNYPITKGTLKAGSNYAVIFVNGTLSVIDREEQEVDIAPVENKTYGDEEFELIIDEGNGTDNNVTFEALTPAVVAVDEDGLVTIVGAGTAEIEVTKAGDDTYADFKEVVAFTVAKKTLTITAHDKTVMIGEDIPELTYDVEGLVGEDTLTGKLATTAKNTNTERDYPITIGTLKAGANYTVVFNGATLSVIDKLIQNVVVVPNVPSSVAYGDDGFEIDVEVGEPATDSEVTFVSDNEEVVMVDEDGVVTIVGAGKAEITVSKAGDDLYADFEEVIEVTVDKVEITVNAEDKGKRVGGDDPELTYSYAGSLVGDDDFTGALVREDGEDVGTYDILQGNLALNDNNYDITFNKGTFTIYDKTPQTITVGAVDAKTYGDEGFTLEVDLGETYNADADTTFTSSDEDVITVDDLGNVTITGAGSAQVTVAREGNADLADFSTNVNITVAKVEITVMADALEKYVGSETPELTYTYEGELVGDDDFSGELEVNDGDIANRKYDIKLGSLTLGKNYKITYIGAKLSVLPKVDRVMRLSIPDGAVFGQEYWRIHLSEFVDGEWIGADAEYTSSNENVAKISDSGRGELLITGAGRTTVTAFVAGDEKYNDWSDSAVFTVAKREITITADDKSKKIGNDDPELTYTLTGEDNATLSDDLYIDFTPLISIGLTDVVLEREAGEEVGEYNIEIKSFTLPLEESYDITLVDGTFTIFDKAPQTITGVESTYARIYGDEVFTLVPVSEELADTTFTYASDNEAVAAVNEAGEVTIVGAGSATVTVIAAGDEDYAATPVKTVITVAPKAIAADDITIDLENKTASIDGAEGVSVDFDKITITLGEVGDETANVTISDIVLTGEGAENYALEEGAAVETTVPVSMLATVTVTIPEAMAEQGTATGEGTYIKGTEVTLTATPARNYKVAQWADGETKLGTAKTYKFVIEEDIEITLTFKKNTGGGVGTTDRTDKDDNKPVDPVDPVDPIDPDDNKDDEEAKGEWKGDDHYSDVENTDWYFEAVKQVTEKGLMNGITETEFAPETQLTRAMLVTVLHRLDGEEEHEHEISFEDVNLEHYYGDALIWAVKHGIILGMSETEFAPDAFITREQMAAILFRYAVYKGMDAVNMAENLESFSDAGEISEYAVSAFNWAVGAGLFEGRDDGTLAPLDNLTRAEAASLITRFTKLGAFAE